MGKLPLRYRAAEVAGSWAIGAGITAMIFPPPRILSLIFFLGLGLTAWAFLNDEKVGILIAHKLPTRSHRRWLIWLRTHRRLFPLVAGLVLALGGLIAFGAPYERLLWRTGHFGEPPLNRFVRIRAVEKEDGRHAVFEFGVTTVAVHGFKIGLHLDGETTTYDPIEPWWGDSGVANRSNARRAYDLYGFLSHKNGWFGRAVVDRAITPDMSAFFDFGTQRHVIDGCYYSPLAAPFLEYCGDPLTRIINEQDIIEFGNSKFVAD